MQNFSNWLVNGPYSMKKISSYGYISRINLIEKVLNIKVSQIQSKEIENIIAGSINSSIFPNKSQKQLNDLKCALRKFIQFKKTSKS
jgi:hypothetical protein